MELRMVKDSEFEAARKFQCMLYMIHIKLRNRLVPHKYGGDPREWIKPFKYINTMFIHNKNSVFYFSNLPSNFPFPYCLGVTPLYRLNVLIK